MARTRTREELPTREQMADAIAQLQKGQRQKTEQEQLHDSILESLADLGGQRVTEDAVLRQGTRLVLPETMSPSDAIGFLSEYVEQQETQTEFSRTFRYRPADGAAALERALKRVFGSAGIGKATWTFFGKQPPELRTINVGVNDTIQVPAGRVAVPSFEGTMMIGATRHREFGELFHLSVVAPRKFKAHIEGLYQVIEDELKQHSIYKGKAVDGQGEPEFIDLSGVNPAEVIYSDEVITQLDANIWSVLQHTEALRSLKIPRKRAVLLEGPYGTGKTLAAFLTAQVATANGWTFIYCRPGKDNLSTVMGMARLYQPAVVFFEDVDVIAESGDKDVVTKLLDMFDGITAKGTEILAVLTTNHKERIHRAMVRPGRLDAMVHIGALDKNGVERMIHATVPEDLIGVLDYDAIYEAMEGYLPAFVKESIDRTMRYAISRGGGMPEVLTTEDFVAAAVGLRPQLDLMNGAGEGVKPDSFGEALRRNVKEALVDTPIHEIGIDEPMYQLLPAGSEN